MAVCWRTLGLALVTGIIVIPGNAQDPKDNKDDVFWEIRQRQEVGSAAQLILARNPLTAAVLRAEGLRWKVWLEPEFLADTVPALNAEWLEDIRDGTPMPDLRGKHKDEIRRDQLAAYKLWSQAVIFANNTPPDLFAKSAGENSHVTFSHLWNDPGKYRGKVIPIKGRLARLRKYDATLAAQKEGVRFVYEGWVFVPPRGSHPYCILFPILPDGLKEAEEMNREVAFSGYFLKKLKYPAADKSKFLEAPVLIGPTVTLTKEPPPPPPSTPISMMVVASVLIVVVAVGGGLVLLGWYFRRGDLALKQRLARVQAERSVGLLDQDENAGAAATPLNKENFGDDSAQIDGKLS